MYYDFENYTSSYAYKEYSKKFKPKLPGNDIAGLIQFSKHSPYKVFNDIATYSGYSNPVEPFEFFSRYKITTETNDTLYKNSLPYFFIYHACSDSASDIINKNKTIDKLKVPLDYFSSGKLFGIDKLNKSIKNGYDLNKEENWNFIPNFIKKEVNKVPVYWESNTEDLESVVEGIYYNTFFKNYFGYGNNDQAGVNYIDFQHGGYNGVYGFSLYMSKKTIEYTKKGSLNNLQILDENTGKILYPVGTFYMKGKGEAPNFPDISVSSFQKLKNKILLNATVVKNSYNSNNFAPKQIVAEDSKLEINSGMNLYNKNRQIELKILGDKSSLFFTSFSNLTLKSILSNYIFNVAEYFNLVHHVLKSAIINYEFIKIYSKDPDKDIFLPNTDIATGIPPAKLGVINSSAAAFSNNKEIKKFGSYIKELIINLLNIVGDKENVSKQCDLFIDYIDQNEPAIFNLYNKDELKNIFLSIEEKSSEVYYYLDPGSYTKVLEKNSYINKYNGKFVYSTFDNKVFAKIDLFDFGTDVKHSNDLLAEKLYVYKSLEKPSSYEDIINDTKLYKIIDFLTIIKDKIPKKENSTSLLEDIKTNTKYYYCFLTQREYDIYKEIVDKEYGVYTGTKKVQHFSSPTKILELEMISTGNSTYLDYNFFLPETKDKLKHIRNFLNKIRISPSEEQKNYNKEKKTFNTPNGLMPFWTKVTKLVNSDDLETGLTLKLRFTSPKTKKKFDINVRHFLNDQFNLPQDLIGKKSDSKIFPEDIESYSKGKKFKEVYSVLQPIPSLNFVKFDSKGNLTKVGEEQYVVEFSDFKYYFNNILRTKTTIKYPNIATNIKIDKSFVNYSKNLELTYTMKKINSNIIFSKNYFPENFPIKIVGGNPIEDSSEPFFPITFEGFLKDINNFIGKDGEEYELSLILKDQFGFIYQEEIPTKVKFIDLTPSYEIKDDLGNAAVIQEGYQLTFTINTKNVENGTTLYWNMFGTGNYLTNVLPSNSDKSLDYMTSNGFADTPESRKVIINNNTAKIIVQFNMDKLTEGDETFKLGLYSSKEYNQDNFLASSKEITIKDTSLTPSPIYSIPSIMDIKRGTTKYLQIDAVNSKSENIYVRVNKNKTTILDSDYKFPLGQANSLLKNEFLPNTLTATIPLQIGFNQSITDQKLLSLEFSETIDGPTVASTSITINPVQTTYSISADKYFIGESEEQINIKVQASVSDGTILYWTIQAPEDNSVSIVSPQDFLVETMNGKVTVINGSANILLRSKEDFLTEGKEWFSFYLRESSISGKVLAKIDYLSINDTSVTPPAPDYVLELQNYLKNSYGITNFDPSTLVAKIDAVTATDFDKFKYNLQQKVWGGQNSTYTSDSNFKLAIIHAGLAKFDDKNVPIKFVYMGKLSNFIGTTNNGITTTNYNSSWNGWRILKQV